ncbi:hypothetical protein CDAR_183461 [Caerostris darwini]|uniref:Uncharacterized protein n=1 Tax=Caerostris darwini TaxID=1538125 RepID=A0AAV4MTX2_9ARAC|nr:hypothetical protein CDAR_183461 [Caerostris darwini]
MRKGISDSFSEGNQLLGLCFLLSFLSRNREMSLGDVYVNDGLGQELNEEENFISEKFLFVKVLFLSGEVWWWGLLGLFGSIGNVTSNGQLWRVCGFVT